MAFILPLYNLSPFGIVRTDALRLFVAVNLVVCISPRHWEVAAGAAGGHAVVTSRWLRTKELRPPVLLFNGSRAARPGKYFRRNLT